MKKQDKLKDKWWNMSVSTNGQGPREKSRTPKAKVNTNSHATSSHCTGSWFSKSPVADAFGPNGKRKCPILMILRQFLMHLFKKDHGFQGNTRVLNQEELESLSDSFLDSQ